MSNEILTYSRRRFNPLTPTVHDIHVTDIAHALSLMTRANGHFRHFYSVAQHSINCSLEARARGLSQRVQLACLLHDASESYIFRHDPTGQAPAGRV
jgi:5'-deoxynucleotidase YfbR-like HD superfamily hydrolase